MRWKVTFEKKGCRPSDLLVIVEEAETVEDAIRQAELSLVAPQGSTREDWIAFKVEAE